MSFLTKKPKKDPPTNPKVKGENPVPVEDNGETKSNDDYVAPYKITGSGETSELVIKQLENAFSSIAYRSFISDESKETQAWYIHGKNAEGRLRINYPISAENGVIVSLLRALISVTNCEIHPIEEKSGKYIDPQWSPAARVILEGIRNTIVHNDFSYNFGTENTAQETSALVNVWLTWKVVGKVDNPNFKTIVIPTECRGETVKVRVEKMKIALINECKNPEQKTAVSSLFSLLVQYSNKVSDIILARVKENKIGWGHIRQHIVPSTLVKRKTRGSTKTMREYEVITHSDKSAYAAPHEKKILPIILLNKEYDNGNWKKSWEQLSATEQHLLYSDFIKEAKTAYNEYKTIHTMIMQRIGRRKNIITDMLTANKLMPDLKKGKSNAYDVGHAFYSNDMLGKVNAQHHHLWSPGFILEGIKDTQELDSEVWDNGSTATMDKIAGATLKEEPLQYYFLQWLSFGMTYNKENGKKPTPQGETHIVINQFSYLDNK